MVPVDTHVYLGHRCPIGHSASRRMPVSGRTPRVLAKAVVRLFLSSLDRLANVYGHARYIRIDL